MKDDLLVPDRRIVSIDEAREDIEKPKPRSVGASSDFVTRREIVQVLVKVNEGIVQASLEVGQKVFDQVGEETAELLERMHHNIRQEILAELAARSFRGRIRRRALQFRDWARGYLTEIGLVSPIAPVPHVEIVSEASAEEPQ